MLTLYPELLSLAKWLSPIQPCGLSSQKIARSDIADSQGRSQMMCRCVGLKWTASDVGFGRRARVAEASKSSPHIMVLIDSSCVCDFRVSTGRPIPKPVSWNGLEEPVSSTSALSRRTSWISKLAVVDCGFDRADCR